MRSVKKLVTFIFILIISNTIIIPAIIVNSQDTENESNQINLENYMIKDTKINDNLPNPLEKTSSFIQPEEMLLYINTTDRFEGFNLFVLDRHNLGATNHDSILMIIDMDGNIIADKFLNTHETELYASAKFINSTTVLFGSLTGARLWNFYTDEMVELGIRGHHDFEYNPNSNTIFTINRYAPFIEGEYYYYDYIQEYNMNGDLIWELDTLSFIDLSQWCPYHDFVYTTPDITHGNTVFYDAEEDMIYFNPRNLNTFYKINHSTKEVVWGLGEWGDFSLFDKYGDPRTSPKNLFYHPHSIEKVDENTFILFDNDYHNQTYEYSYYSRMLEITINETTMTANVSWDWVGSSAYTSYYWSDADRLPNGNRFGTFGTFNHVGASSIGARLVEVDEEGGIVWEIYFPKTINYRYGIYQANRFQLSPIISSTNDYWFATNEHIQVEWQTWYNFRDRQMIEGSYSLFVEDTLVDTGVVNFERFWKSTNLSYDLGLFTDGQYNITLVVVDDAGHSSSNTIIVNVGDFYLEREGPEEIELGSPDSIVKWNGFTASTLWLNLTVNDILERSEEWNDTFIEFDLNTLQVGINNITLQLYNGTSLIYKDSFLVQVFPNELPELLLQPNNISYVWNTTIILNWEFFDNSPFYWDILINDTKYDSDFWNTKNYTLIWQIPTLDEEVYNLSLVIYDCAGNHITSTIWLTIIAPSPPIISAVPINTEIVWGQSYTTLKWEVHGGTQWTIFKDSILLSSGIIQSKFVEYSIDYWYSNMWFPGLYNLTLFVEDDYGNSTYSSTMISIVVHLSDPYVNDYVSTMSFYYTNGDNAIGAPDGIITRVYSEYSAGYITLDMGRNEEILDGLGDDFTVVVFNGIYTCWVGNDLSSPFSLISSGNGNTSFDLASIGLSSVRYVRIQYQSGFNVELDAIVALNYNHPTEDNDSPEIIGPEDFWIWNNQSSFTINWEIFELTPFSYSISVNQEVIESGYWDGSDITFTYNWTDLDRQVVVLTLDDIFGNIGKDSVIILIQELPTEPITTTPIKIIGCLLGIAFLVSLIKLEFSRKTKKDIL